MPVATGFPEVAPRSADKGKTMKNMAIPAQASATAPQDAEAAQILARLAERASCRAFDGTAIDRETVRAIVSDALQAPSSCNQQQWHFVVIDDRETLRRCCEIAGGNPHFADCSALIYLTFQKGWTHDNFSTVQGVAAAAYHMMLSAHLRGFSSIWNAGIGSHADLRALLDLPQIFELQGAIAIGRERADAPQVKAPRRALDEVMSFGGFQRPGHTIYPVKPAPAYPYFEITKARNPFAVWCPEDWSWEQVADFRGYSVWAKSPLAGVYQSRRQGEATERELDLLPALPAGARVAELMGWGGTSTAALRARLPADAHLDVVELAQQNLEFIRVRLAQEGLGALPTDFVLSDGPRLPQADRSLDAVIVPQVLEHAPDKPALLREVHRVLKPEGVLLLSARNLTSRAGRHWRQVESLGAVPIQGPFEPIPARQLAELLAPLFDIEDEVGIGLGTGGDAEVTRGPLRYRRRIVALRARPRH